MYIKSSFKCIISHFLGFGFCGVFCFFACLGFQRWDEKWVEWIYNQSEAVGEWLWLERFGVPRSCVMWKGVDTYRAKGSQTLVGAIT